ncbi:Na-translocating system protein MpsC family protein, partial [Staphylococcus aureus]
MNTIDTHTKEQQFSNLVRSYRKEYVGKGPNSIRVSFKDLIVKNTWVKDPIVFECRL